MELNQLRYFCVVARLQHLTRAAEELHISQPSLSKTIMRLEDALGVPLFNRAGNRICLNSYGKAFLARAERVFKEINEGQSELERLAGLEYGHVSVACCIQQLPAALLSDFLLKYPDVDFHQKLLQDREIIELLYSGEIDFGIATRPDNLSGLTWEPLLNENIYLFVSEGHPLAGRESVTLKELENETFVRSGFEFGIPAVIDRCFEAQGITPQFIYEGIDRRAIGDLVSAGVAVSFISAQSYYHLMLAHHRIPKGRALLITDPGCIRELGLLSMTEHYFSKAAREFYNMALDYFKAFEREMRRVLG